MTPIADLAPFLPLAGRPPAGSRSDPASALLGQAPGDDAGDGSALSFEALLDADPEAVEALQRSLGVAFGDEGFTPEMLLKALANALALAQDGDDAGEMDDDGPAPTPEMLATALATAPVTAATDPKAGDAAGGGTADKTTPAGKAAPTIDADGAGPARPGAAAPATGPAAATPTADPATAAAAARPDAAGPPAGAVAPTKAAEPALAAAAKTTRRAGAGAAEATAPAATVTPKSRTAEARVAETTEPATTLRPAAAGLRPAAGTAGTGADGNPGSADHRPAGQGSPTGPALATAAPTTAERPVSATFQATLDGLGRPSAAPAEQVSVKIRQAVADGTRQITVRLVPASLGGVEVTLEVADDRPVQARIIVDKSETLELLRRDGASLERALGQAGLQTDQGSLNFSLRGQGQGQGQLDDRAAAGHTAAADESEPDDGEPDLTDIRSFGVRPNGWTADGRLDLSI